jgi:hypothetical protein
MASAVQVRNAAVGVAVVCITVLYRLRRRIKQLEIDLKHAAELRDSEHNGRVNIERELRRVVAAKMQDGDALYYSPIGHVSSCFKRCLGMSTNAIGVITRLW